MGRKKSRARKQQGTNPAHESEAGYRRLVELSFDGIIVHEKGKIVFANPAGAELIGAETPEQLVGKSILDFVHPDHQGIVEERVRKVREGKKVPLIEEKFVRLDGRELDVEVIGTSITYEGKPAVQVVFRDITERVRSEEALRQSEEKWRSLVQNVPDLIVTIAPDGAIMAINRTVSGIAVEEVIGKSVGEYVPLKDRDRLLEAVKQVFLTGEAESLEVLGVGPQGPDTAWYELRIIPVERDEKVVAATLVATDITERVRTEEVRQQAEDLTRAQRDLGLTLGTTHGLDETLRLCTEAAIRASGMDCGGVYLVDESTGDLDLAFHTGLPPDFIRSTAHYDADSANARLVMAGEPLYTRHLVLGTPLDEPRRIENLRAIAVIPIRYEDQIIACLNIASHTLDEVPDFARTALETIAAQIGSAIVRAKVGKALQESEERYRTLVETSPDAITITDLDGRLVWANQRSLELHGCERVEELLGLDAFELIAPEDRQRAVENAHKTLETGSIRNVEYTILKRDGTHFSAELSASVIVDADGKPTAFIGVLRDVTERVRSEEERKRTEEALRESERFLQSVFDGIQDGISVLDNDLNIIQVNAWMENLYASQMPLVSEKCYTVYQQRESPCPWCPSLPALKTGKSHHEIVPYPSGADPIGWIALSAFPLKDATGRVVGVVEHVKDITERKLLEHEIEERRLYLESVLASVPDAIVALDAQHKILEWNPGAEKLFGYTQEETVGQDLDMLVAGPNTDKHDEATGLTRRFLRGESLPPFKTVRYRKDGTPVDVLVSGSPIMLGDEMVGIVGVYTDITERVRSEEERARTEKTMRRQEQLAAVGQLAGGIAHDFNNLLTTIMLYAQMPLGKPDLPSHAARALETILGESRQAAQLVQQILDFSRRSPIETHPVDLEPFVNDSVRVLQRTIPESISLLLKIEPGEYVVNADPTRIQQVLMNLVVNARDAMPGGGRLTISLSRVTLSPSEEPPVAGMPPLSSPPPAGGTERGWICLAVSDTGTGIPPEALPHIYEPFFTTKPTGEGTGLGLAQVYGIVKQHEGHIRLETEVDKGTTFRIYLPPHQAGEEEAPQEEAAAPAPGKGETILLVEDNKRIRKAGREILESLGYQVLTAANGREALGVYQAAESVDLVLTDVVMPEMGGAELVRELVKVNPRLKALAVTGHLLAEEWEDLNARGIIDVIYKPFNANALGRMVRSALDLDED